MGWLRRDKDLIGLVLAWAILLQAVIFSFTAGAHAATLASGLAGSILCTTKGLSATGELPGKKHQEPHWCCSLTCRIACAGSSGGILPTAARVSLPLFAGVSAPFSLPESPAAREFCGLSGQPRAPPLA